MKIIKDQFCISFFISLILMFCLISCFSTKDEKKNETGEITLADWTGSFDFDGDRVVDTIEYTYTGGAHCCYEVSIYLSSGQYIYQLPVLIEGGYLHFDLSKPEQFDIRDIDNDNLPEIIVDTGDIGKKVVDFQSGEFVIIDFNEADSETE